MRTRDAEAELNLPPGFRFHPTDEELVVDYLCCKAQCRRLPVPIIAEIDMYKYDPWDLPEKALFGSKEWYFFTPRDRKYPNGSRPNRSAASGYWKATGADKPVRPKGSNKPLGIKKALVFYNGKAPKGVKTDWIMHEYRLADANRSSAKTNGSLRLDDWVLCRLYNKKNNYKKVGTESFGEDSHVSDNATSESLRTPESVLYQSSGIKEEGNDDWIMDLNVDDLHGILGFNGTLTPTTSGFDFFSQDCLMSPSMKFNQFNTSPFFQ